MCADTHVRVRAHGRVADELCDVRIRTYIHTYTYDSHWPLHFVGYAFTSMLDLFRGDIDGQAQLIWTPQGSPSLPFTYLCYDSASLDLIDGIAINLRISCRVDATTVSRDTRIHTHIYICIRMGITGYVYIYIYKYDSLSLLHLNFNEYRLG